MRRNDSGGRYSDKVDSSVMAGGLPDVLTVDGYSNSGQIAVAMEYFRMIVENEYMSEAQIDHLFESGRAAL